MFTFIPIVLTLSSLALTSASPLVVRQGGACVPNSNGMGVQLNTPDGKSLVPIQNSGTLGPVDTPDSLTLTTSAVAQFLMQSPDSSTLRFSLVSTDDKTRTLGVDPVSNVAQLVSLNPSDANQLFAINCFEGCQEPRNNGDSIGLGCTVELVGQQKCLDSNPSEEGTINISDTVKSAPAVAECRKSDSQKFTVVVRTT